VFAAGIQAVVELADNEPLASLPRELVRCRFPLSDAGNNPVWLLRLASDSVAALLRAGIPTIVCCSSGLNRSIGVAAAGLAIAEGRSLDETLLEVATKGPVDVSPALLAMLRDAFPK
jgi:hypothetical protein